MARFDRAGRDTPAGVLPDALSGHAPGVGISAEDAVRAYELERVRRQRATNERKNCTVRNKLRRVRQQRASTKTAPGEHG